MPPPGPQFTPTLIGCPACAGVLSVRRESPHLRFECSIGHAFSLQSLFQAKEEQLETCLWSVTSLLEHVEMLCGMFVEQIDAGEVEAQREGLTRRAHQVRAQLHQIRQLIEETETPDLGQKFAEAEEA